jgi:hypothetical protein
VRPVVYELRWDDQILDKLWKKRRVQSWEVEDVVLDDPDADFRWQKHRRHGGRLMVRGRTRAGRRLIVILDPVDPGEGIWRCRTAWEER